MRGSTRRELGDLAVTAVLAAGLLVATAIAAGAGTHHPGGAGPEASRFERSVDCRTVSVGCSGRSPAHVRLTVEPRTGVCLT